MFTIKEFIIGTPWYVYLIIVYLIFVGIKAVKGGNVHINKLVILPLVFLYLSLETLSHHQVSLENISIWVAGLAVGAYILGWLPYQRLGVKAIPLTHIIQTPGSYFTLCLIVMTFMVKYTCAALIAMQYHFSDLSWNGLLYVSGLYTGAFLGRLIYATYHLYIKPGFQSSAKI